MTDEITVKTSRKGTLRKKSAKKRVSRSVVRPGGQVTRHKVEPTVGSRRNEISVEVLPPHADGLSSSTEHLLEVTRVETLMLRGVYNTDEILKHLNHNNVVNSAGREYSRREVMHLMKAVEARWEYLGQALNTATMLGKELASLGTVEREYWKLYQKFSREKDGERDSVLVLKCIVDLYKQRCVLTGVDKVTVRELRDSSNSEDIGKNMTGDRRAMAANILNKFIKWAANNKKTDET